MEPSDHLFRRPAGRMVILHILCGFSVDEVAGALVSSHDAIEVGRDPMERRFSEQRITGCKARAPIVLKGKGGVAS